MESLNLVILFLAAIVSLSVLIFKSRWLGKQEVKEPKLIEISSYIKTGVLSFIKRQYMSSGIV
ncbi:MAG: hypothetical protein PHX76_03355, partial [Patescibacteria group bacterium]|nr:hypothetical protein [Patescibacteria group bacterium]